MNTKLHAIVDGLGNSVEFMLSAGNDHDSVYAVELLEKVEIGGSNVLADRASDPWPVDWCMYKERHLVECLFQKLKWFRRIAKRYDKLDASFLAFVYLASFSAICSPPASPTGVNSIASGKEHTRRHFGSLCTSSPLLAL